MTTLPLDAPPVTAAPTYFAAERTIRSWLLTTDHKRIGVLYLVSLLFMLALGGFYAMAIRIEHLSPQRTVMSAMAYNRFFTLHGVIMVWLFLIPSIPSSFGNFVVPIMLGAKDVAFPRLNLMSWYVFVAGATLVLVSMFVGGIDTGWTFYAPYSSISLTAVPTALLGVFIVGLSTIMTGVNFIVTTHTMRTAGMGWMRMPLFVWAIYATSIIQVLATPVDSQTIQALFGSNTQVDPAAQTDLVLSHPEAFWTAIRTTAGTGALGIATNMVGILGRGFIPISQMAVLLVVASLMATLVATRDGPTLGWWGRTLVVAVCGVTMIALALAMYIGASGVGATEVAGLQGRYFIPVLAVGLFAVLVEK